MRTTHTKKWSGLFGQTKKPVAGQAMQRPVGGEGSDADALGRQRYLAALRSPAPSQWQTDHLRESQRMRGAIYVALKVLGDQAAGARACAYKWHPDARMNDDKDAKQPLPYDHPLSRLILHPNPRETGGMLRRRQVHQVSLTGTSLLWRVDNGFGVPRELWSISTGTYQPVAPSSAYPEGAYRVMPWYPGPLAMVPGTWSAGGVVVGAEHMIRTMHPHPLVQWEGLSPLAACELALDTIESVDRARFARMRRQVVPSCVIEADPSVLFPQGDELTRLREEVNQLMGGPDKAGRPALLGPGMEIKPWGESNIEVGWIDSWAQLVEFVLSVFGITKSLAFMSEETTFAALYASLRQFNLFSLCPLLNLLADGFNLGLTWPYFGDDYFVEYEPAAITDEDQLIKKLDLASKYSVIKKNELRVALDYEPTNEPWGEELVTPSKAGPGQPGQENGQGGGLFGGGKPEEEQGQSPAMQRVRPRNEQGQGSLGDRRLLNGAAKHLRGR